EAAAGALAEIDQELADAGAEEREAEQEQATWSARREALELGLKRRDGAGALLAAGERLSGLLGSVAALLTVEPGYENAMAAALGARGAGRGRRGVRQGRRGRPPRRAGARTGGSRGRTPRRAGAACRGGPGAAARQRRAPLGRRRAARPARLDGPGRSSRGGPD